MAYRLGLKKLFYDAVCKCPARSSLIKTSDLNLISILGWSALGHQVGLSWTKKSYSLVVSTFLCNPLIVSWRSLQSLGLKIITGYAVDVLVGPFFRCSLIFGEIPHKSKWIDINKNFFFSNFVYFWCAGNPWGEIYSYQFFFLSDLYFGFYRGPNFWVFWGTQIL